MALRAVPDHPKFMAFKSLLKLPKGAALGWIEAMWHFAGRFTPHGNIGKYTDAQIEAWVEWDGAPGALIVALIECGWIDKSTDHRLLVHDWANHSDRATKEAVRRSQKPFVEHGMSTACPRHDDIVPESSTASSLPVPVPVPVPESSPDPEPVLLAPSPAEPIAGTPFLGLPTNRADEAFIVTEEMLDGWHSLYPAVDARQQIRNMRGWLDGNPERRKTRKGMTRFIHNWLGDKQNKAGGVSGTDRAGGSETRGAAVGRVERGVAAVNRAAEQFGWTEAGGDGGPDGRLLPAPGDGGGNNGGVSARPQQTGRETRAAGGEDRAADVAHQARPEVLPPSERSSRGVRSHGD